MVWMPPSTGTHMGGRWVEVDDSASGGANALNVKRGSAEAVSNNKCRDRDHRACRVTMEAARGAIRVQIAVMTPARKETAPSTTNIIRGRLAAVNN